MAFTQKLSKEALAYFNEVVAKPFSGQAVAFLNAYWAEVGDQAEFIFGCAWEVIKYADMHAKGVSYVHLYQEGSDLDFNIGLYFYETLCKNLEEKSEYKQFKKFEKSQPEMMTAIVRKTELREKVDVNFDGRVSFLEYLLYQYRSFANPSDFVTRSTSGPPVDPEAIERARLALEDVSNKIKAYEAEKARLEAEAQKPGVKGLGAKNMLAQLGSSPLQAELAAALIKAEAAIRILSKPKPVKPGQLSNDGAIWWMTKDLEEKKKRYGKK